MLCKTEKICFVYRKMFANPGAYVPFQTQNGIASINEKVGRVFSGRVFSDNLLFGVQTQLYMCSFYKQHFQVWNPRELAGC